ncbi:hypothetical protein J2046_000256 [Rhizobium petrolearium]|uniref:phage tail tape measure protein n=1 Tax=Neorhizobium petrolearium TaxID=515361 RepID=UPI001AE78EBE|nr:phage tail tape measure protein [Neorhizobium petrolearium]MBP1842012.1 hypothetical protein [Neorhizobium petrolearium]
MNAVIGALRVVLGLDSAALESGATKAEARMKKLGSSIKTGLAVAAGAAAAAGTAIAAGVRSAINEADEMSKAAAKIGVPIEELSRLKYAADLSGVSFEGLQTSVGRLAKMMNEAKNGSKSALDTFSQLGIVATNADGSLKSTSQVLSEVADRFADMPEGAEKTALAMELMGRSGANMIPLLNGGSQALQDLMKEADSFGTVFTQEMGSNAEAFNDNISRLQGVLANISAAVATNLVPYLAQFSDWLVQAVGYFRGLSPEMQGFVSIAATLTAGMAALAVPLGVVAAGIAAVGLPIAGVVAGIGLFATAVVAFWPQIQQLGTAISEFLSGAWASFISAWDGISAKINAVGPVIEGFVADLIAAFAALPAKMQEIGGQIIEGLWNGIKAKWESVKQGIYDIGDSISQSVRDALGIHSPSQVMHDIGLNIVQGLTNGINTKGPEAVAAAQNVVGGIKGAFDGIEDVGAGVGDGISNAFGNVGSSIADAIKGTKDWRDVMVDALRSIGSNAVSSLGQLMGGGSGGGGFGGIITSLLGGLFGFASGGSFQVGGAGGIDSQLVAFKASPNETVTVTKPGQQGASARGPQKVDINVNVSGARGNQEIQDMVSAGVQQGLSQYDRALPGRISDITERNGG